MSNSKHTPGPWVIRADEIKTNTVYHIDTGINSKSDVAQNIESISDANLISAAPEMLEALEFVIKRLTGNEGAIQANITFDTPFDSMAFKQVIDSAVIAINKAKGEK